MQDKELVQAIGEFESAQQQLARKAEQQYALEVAAILQSQCRDPRQIERLLDGMLDFCFDAQLTLAPLKTKSMYQLLPLL